MGLITESRLNQIAIKWLNTKFGNLEPFETQKNPNAILYRKGNDVIFEYNKRNGDVYISYDEIWSFLILMFGIEHQQIQDLIKEWVVERYNLRVRRAQLPSPHWNLGW